MRTRERKPLDAARVPLGVNVNDVLPWQSLGPRLGWGKRQRADAAKAGLRFAVVGRMKVTTGEWLWEFIEKLAEQQLAGGGQ
jgi:hypothetical protein